jgi:hypothetical protein
LTANAVRNDSTLSLLLKLIWGEVAATVAVAVTVAVVVADVPPSPSPAMSSS